jgi:two-component system chemotaxis sensor kinase CheA
MTQDPYKYFRIEARELLDHLHRGLLELERGASPKETVGHLLRQAHTLKGACRVVRQPAIAEHAHRLEELLGPYRSGELPVPSAVREELLRLLTAVEAGTASLDAPAQESPRTLGPAADERFETIRVEIRELDLLLDQMAEIEVGLAALRQEAGALLRTGREIARALAQFAAEPRLEAPGHSLRQGAAGRGSACHEPAGRLHARQREVLSELEQLQRLMQTRIERAETDLGTARDLAGRMRLVPAGVIFDSLERTARDAAGGANKQVQFRTTGGEVRLDAHVLGALHHALQHVVRNAVAHGIEPVPARLAAGKPSAGTIGLSVRRAGDGVAFTCEDDGTGLDVEAIRRAAEARGLTPGAQEGEAGLPAAAAPSEQTEASGSPGASPILEPGFSNPGPRALACGSGLSEAARLVLEGGLTTALEVTEVSGRGVGMDVVRETMARLKGRASLRTAASGGLLVELLVPVSLLAVSALQAEWAGATVWFPQDSVARVLRVKDSEVTGTPEGAVLPIDGEAVPYAPLGVLLRSLEAEPPSAPGSAMTVVVLRGDGGTAAIGLHRVRGVHNVVVRPLPAAARVSPLVGGVAFDVEGTPQLVLSPRELAQAARGVELAVTQPPPSLPILVIDDSLTTRMLEQSILESAGYSVELALSAEEALTMARSRQYALFVVDVEMPGMDGFEFVERTRADSNLARVPAILVTSRGAAEDRRRGLQAGASAYIVKSDFDQTQLLKLIKTLMA